MKAYLVDADGHYVPVTLVRGAIACRSLSRAVAALGAEPSEVAVARGRHLRHVPFPAAAAPCERPRSNCRHRIW